MGCSNSLALKYIKRILKLSFIKLDEKITDEMPKTVSATVEEIMINSKEDGGGDDDVLEDSDDDDEESTESSNSSEEEDDEIETDQGGNDNIDTDSDSSGDEVSESDEEEDTVEKTLLDTKFREKSEGAFLNRLYQYDEEIFDPSFPDGGGDVSYDSYDKVCQSSRIPKVLSQEEKEEVDRIDKDLEDRLRQEPGKEHIEIKSYGFGPFDRDCEYQSTKSGFDEKKLFFDSKLLDDEYIKTYGGDAEYGDIIKLKLHDKDFILDKSGKKEAKIKWSFYYNDPVTNAKVNVTDIDYKRLTQLFDENKHIRSQNPIVSVQYTGVITPSIIHGMKYPIRKICKVRFIERGNDENKSIEASYGKLLDDPSAKVKAMKCKSIKYGTDKDNSLNWYMCPRLYDKQTNRPLHWRMLQYSKVSGETFEPFDWGDEKNWRKAKHDLTLDIMDFNPGYPKDDPDPSRLWVYPKSGGVGGGGAYFYPGFLSHTKHPLSISRTDQNKEPIFPPCCYQKYSNRFSELLNPSSPKNVNKCGEPLNTTGDKYFTIGEEVEGNIGHKLNKLFGQEDCSSKDGFIRKGINQGANSYFNLIFDILDLPAKQYPSSIEKTNIVKDSIIASIITGNVTDNSKLSFNDINGGFLEILFRKRGSINSFQNFIEYTLSDDVKRYDLFYEITTSPQFIGNCNNVTQQVSKSEEISNLILIVFEISKRKNQSSYSIKINCPYFSKKISENLNNLTDDTHIAFAIKYNQVTSNGLNHIFEPIYYKTNASTITGSTIKKTFKISEIYREDYNEKTLHFQKIKNILNKFKDTCYVPANNITLNMEGNYNIITYKKLNDFITFNAEKLKQTDILPLIAVEKDSNNKVSGIQFKHEHKIYTVAIFPESINKDQITKLTNYIGRAYYDGNDAAISDAKKRTGYSIPGIDEYESFYDKIRDISSKSVKTGIINIKPLKYFGLFIDHDSAKINLDVKGFATSFLSDAESYKNINIDQTLVYTLCNGSTKSLNEDQIIYDYAAIDKFIFDEEKTFNKIKPLKPVEIAKDKENTVYNFLIGSSDFGISTLYRDNSEGVINSKIVLIKTNKGVFIPIMPLDELSLDWNELNFTGDIEDLYVNISKTAPKDPEKSADAYEIGFVSDPIGGNVWTVQIHSDGTKYWALVKEDFNQSIKISESLLTYCSKIKDLSKTTNFQMAIFIKNLNINNKPVTRGPKGGKTMGVETYLTSVYLESGLITLLGGEDALPLEIAVENPNKGTKSFKLLKVLDKDSDNNYTINEVKKCNLNFYTQRYINDNNLNISINYQDEVQVSKFRYDSIIYEVLIKKLNEFFSRQLNKTVKYIKLFILKVVNSVSNKSMHDDIKKRLLYPLIYAILSIIIKPVILEEGVEKYPNININTLSNIESEAPINLKGFTKGDVDKYIIKSYTLINNTDDDSVIESIPALLREHAEYYNIRSGWDFTKVTKLYYTLHEEYRGNNYVKLEIIDLPVADMSRSEILKHKLCNNLIYNSFIQEQVFGVYKPNIFSNSRFKYNMGFEILFTKSEKDNYEKLNSLYSFTKQKYFRDIKYPDARNVKTSKIYKFTEKGKTNVIPFLYRFRLK